MSEKERQEFSIAIKKYGQELSKNKDASRAFLIKAGILTPKGNLRKTYKHLCIPQEQD